MSVSGLTLSDLFRADFRTSRDADDLNTRAQAALGLDYRYQVARLALAVSLAEAKPTGAASDLLGKPIRGETLFGQDEADLALWIALIIQHDPEAGTSKKRFLEIAGAHWERGMRKLWREWEKHKGPPEIFLASFALQRGVVNAIETA